MTRSFRSSLGIALLPAIVCVLLGWAGTARAEVTELNAEKKFATFKTQCLVGGKVVAWSAPITVTGSEAIPAGEIAFKKTLTGAFNVDVNTAGNTLFNGNVNIAQLTTDAPGTVQINAATVTTNRR